jgi:DNA-binding NarL/FixJ family response regulator
VKSSRTDTLQDLVVTCLEELASLARAHGQPFRAARLQDAVALLRDLHTLEPAMPSHLTRREWEVAQLIAHGLSNRRIAEQLVLSERTVDSHVSHILRKLGCGSRAQIAAWAVTNTRPLTLLA